MHEFARSRFSRCPCQCLNALVRCIVYGRIQSFSRKVLTRRYRQKAGIRLGQSLLPRSESFHAAPEIAGGDTFLTQETIEWVMTPAVGILGKIRLREVMETRQQKLSIIGK